MDTTNKSSQYEHPRSTISSSAYTEEESEELLQQTIISLSDESLVRQPIMCKLIVITYY